MVQMNLSIRRIYQFIAVISFLFLSSEMLFSQDSPKQLQAKYITENIKIDGILDEAVWDSADVATDFWQFFPKDSVKADYPTVVSVVYNKTTLYVGIRAKSPNDNYVVTSLKRDFGGTTNDNVTLLFDTFNDGTNAFAFGVTPYGVRREILVSSGGATQDGYNTTWDVKWLAESQIHDDYYTVEIAIPFTSIKFEEGATKWGFRPYRWNIQTNEQTTWTRVPQTQLLGNLAFMGELIFEKPLGKSRTTLTFIPYVNGLAQRNFSESDNQANLLIGADAKVAVGDGMNLDLTYNPDFSNVEVDDIFTNLTRFELLLPEKRQFFIDNSDLFASFGNYFNEARPFFSRRIGLARDTANNLIQNRIIAGARLSGKLDENWRLGFLNIQTAADEPNEIASNNNMMFALQRKIGSRSNLGVFMVNRQTFGEYDFIEDNEKFNRVIGADYNLATADNVWSGRFYAHKSINPDDSKGNYSAQAIATYNKNNWVIISDWVYVDSEFQADLGFVPRRDIFKVGNSVQRYFIPKNRNVINRHNGQLLFINYFRPTLNNKMSDYLLRTSWTTEFKNQANITAHFLNQYIYLTADFDPTRKVGGNPLPSDSDYTFNQINLIYTSSNTNLFTYTFNTTLGEFFNGNRYSAGGTVAYRVQPYAQFSLNVNYDGIRLPEPYESADLWLVTPRIDITFSKSLFWTTLVQYSNQRENLGINSRLQWRFAPLSDLYLVYNDNFYTADFSPRFRSINLKLSYWLNI
jgi:hypothetical protein